jgi:hypothetical protein
LRKDKKIPDAEGVLKYLLQTGFVFDVLNQKHYHFGIYRSIGPNESVDLLPTLAKIYRECEKSKSQRAMALTSELAGLLVAAELGIGKKFLIELEIQKTLPKLLNLLRQDLKSAAAHSEAGTNKR